MAPPWSHKASAEGGGKLAGVGDSAAWQAVENAHRAKRMMLVQREMLHLCATGFKGVPIRELGGAEMEGGLIGIDEH